MKIAFKSFFLFLVLMLPAWQLMATSQRLADFTTAVNQATAANEDKFPAAVDKIVPYLTEIGTLPKELPAYEEQVAKVFTAATNLRAKVALSEANKLAISNAANKLLTGSKSFFTNPKMATKEDIKKYETWVKDADTKINPPPPPPVVAAPPPPGAGGPVPVVAGGAAEAPKKEEKPAAPVVAAPGLLGRAAGAVGWLFGYGGAAADYAPTALDSFKTLIPFVVSLAEKREVTKDRTTVVFTDFQKAKNAFLDAQSKDVSDALTKAFGTFPAKELGTGQTVMGWGNHKQVIAFYITLGTEFTRLVITEQKPRYSNTPAIVAALKTLIVKIRESLALADKAKKEEKDVLVERIKTFEATVNAIK